MGRGVRGVIGEWTARRTTGGCLGHWMVGGGGKEIDSRFEKTQR